MFLQQFPGHYNVEGHLPRMTVLLLDCPFLISFIYSLDLLQVPLEDTQHKFKIVGMDSGSNVWPKICRLARETCTLPVLMNN